MAIQAESKVTIRRHAILPRDHPTNPIATQVVRNGLFNASGWFVTVLLSIISTPYFVSKLTLEGYGVYVLLTGLVGYYNLLDLGLGQAVVKFVAEYSAKGERTELNRSINAALTVQIILGLIGSVVGIVFADPFLNLLNVPSALHQAGLTGLYACAGGFLVTMFTSTFSSVLNGLQRYDITAKTNITMNSSLVVCIAAALYSGFGLQEAIFLTVAFALLTGIVYFILLKRLLIDWRPSLQFSFSELKKLFSFSGFMFVSQISNLFSSYLVRVVISVILGPAAVTLYVIPAKLVGAFGGLLSSGFSVLFPAASALGAVGDREKIRRGFVESSKLFASLSVPILLLLSLFAEPVLAIWMGSDFAREGWVILRLISLAGLVGSLTTVPNSMTLGLGHSRIVAYFSILTLLSYLVSLPLLTLSLGVRGTAWAMLVSTIPGVLLMLFEAKRIFGVRPFDYVHQAFGFHLTPFAISMLAIAVTLVPINQLGVTSNLAVCSGCCLIYFGVMVWTGWLPIRRYIKY